MVPKIQHSLQAWANALGEERRTLERRLTKAGIVVPKSTRSKKSEGLTALQIVTAFIGDSDAENRRLTVARAEKIERENALESGLINTREGFMAELAPPLIHIADAWRNFDKDVGAKMQDFMVSAGVSPEIAKHVRKMASTEVEGMASNLRKKMKL